MCFTDDYNLNYRRKLKNEILFFYFRIDSDWKYHIEFEVDIFKVKFIENVWCDLNFTNPSQG